MVFATKSYNKKGINGVYASIAIYMDIRMYPRAKSKPASRGPRSEDLAPSPAAREPRRPLRKRKKDCQGPSRGCCGFGIQARVFGPRKRHPPSVPGGERNRGAKRDAILWKFQIRKGSIILRFFTMESLTGQRRPAAVASRRMLPPCAEVVMPAMRRKGRVPQGSGKFSDLLKT